LSEEVPVKATRLSRETLYAADMRSLVRVYTRLVNAIYTGARRPVLGAYTA
jgi:hypothetical protein